MARHALLLLSLAGGHALFGSAAKAPHAAASVSALKAGLAEVSALRETVAAGRCVPELGKACDAICTTAEAEMAAAGADAKAAAAVVERLDKALRCVRVGGVHLLFSSARGVEERYAKQLAIARDAALQAFRRSAGQEYEGLVEAERAFSRAAEASSRAEWTYDAELADLREALAAVAGASAAAREATIKAAQSRAQIFTVLKRLVVELTQATAQRLGGDSPWDAGAALRVPDTNINLSLGVQRGKSQLVVSCVPDDSANLLSPSGFNKPKVGSGDLALSYKCDV